MIGRPPIPLFDRISKSAECWIWTGPVNESGYGNVGGKLIHRAVYTRLVGPIPRGLCVLHRCDNPRCCNPDHLWLGTRRENNEDRHRKGRDWQRRITHCPRGHPYSEENTRHYRGERQCRACGRLRWHERRSVKNG